MLYFLVCNEKCYNYDLYTMLFFIDVCITPRNIYVIFFIEKEYVTQL